MQSPDAESLAPLLWATALALVVANLVVLQWSVRLRACTGRVLVARRPRRGARLVLLTGVALVGVAVVLGGEAVDPTPAFAVLGLSALMLAQSPGFLDSCYGERGVQLGWHARRFEDLEEWRLTGDHLRWKLRGIWVACDVPVRLHPELRTKLERLCPGRESPFGR